MKSKSTVGLAAALLSMAGVSGTALPAMRRNSQPKKVTPFMKRQQDLRARAKAAMRGAVSYSPRRNIDKTTGKPMPYRKQRAGIPTLLKLLSWAHNNGQRRRYQKALDRAIG